MRFANHVILAIEAVFRAVMLIPSVYGLNRVYCWKQQGNQVLLFDVWENQERRTLIRGLLVHWLRSWTKR